MAAKRKILPYIILGLGIAAAATVAGVYIFRKRKKKVSCESRFLFIGDSNVANPGSFANILKNYCPDASVTILAQVGEKTGWMLTQLQQAIASNKYDVITILGGSNDIYALGPSGNTVQTKSNLSEMYKMAKESGATVVAVSPPNKDYYPNRTDHKQALLYDLVNWIPKNKDVDFFINLHQLTKDRSNLASDNQHMSAKGKQELIAAWANKVLTNV